LLAKGDLLEYCIVLSTAANKNEAYSIANSLVENRLAACVNIVENIDSIYIWDDKVCKDSEVLMIIKTKKEFFKLLKDKILELHSYDVPEIICLDIKDGDEKYLNWIDKVTINFKKGKL